MCLLCSESVSVMKEYNVRRHYVTRHSAKYDSFQGERRKEKVQNMIKNLKQQQSIFTKKSDNADNQRSSSRPPNPQLGGPRPTLGAQVSLKLLFGYVTIFSSADLFTTDLNCRKKLACDIISECYVILSRRILNIRLT